MLNRAGTILLNLLLITIYCRAQPVRKTNYDVLWKRVDSLVVKRTLTTSALAEVNRIYQLAKKEKQDVQIIKALQYRLGLQEALIENSDIKGIEIVENEIITSNEPAKSILTYLLAEKYLQYFEQHRWQLYERTQTIQLIKEDIANWGLEDFHRKITELFLAAIKNEKLFQGLSLERFDPLIIKGNVRYLRPTMYDLLMQGALDYFKNEEKDIIKPAYSFEIKDPQYFAPAGQFSTLVITTSDSSSLYHKALGLYQKLLAFHLEDTKPNALIDIDIHRLQFVWQKGIMDNKDSLYETALMALGSKYENQPVAAQAFYLIAQLHADKASTYEPMKIENSVSDNSKGEYKIAVAICKKVLDQKEDSEGRTNCSNLLRQIEREELALSTEKVNIPGQPFRTLVSYRNFKQLYLRLLPMSEEVLKLLTNSYGDKYWQQITRIASIRSWIQPLVATDDYQKHHTEIKVDALPVGDYILLASAKEDFNPDNNPLALQNFHVSNISYINNGEQYFVLHRETGKPLVNAVIQIWGNKYDYNKRTYIPQKRERLQTDKNGYVKLPVLLEKEDRSVLLEIIYEKDRLFIKEAQYIPFISKKKEVTKMKEESYEEEEARVFFFTDRSIYRPGQTIYFKGIAITKEQKTKKNKLYTGIKSTVLLFNANDEKVDSVEVTTNSYGSYAGTLQLPVGLLNGRFYLRDKNFEGDMYFAVEEYKRPKFYVGYEPVKSGYKVNDSIVVIGFARGYSGINIDGAKVNYRVQRVARFSNPWYYERGGYHRGSNVEITHGTVTAGVGGTFKIVFKALPDASISKDLNPIFDYQVSADVTDISGETRSGLTTIPVSYKALQLKINLPAFLPTDSLKSIYISTQNLNGAFQPALVYVTMYRLISPGRLIRKRYWHQPDQFTMTQEEFVRNFPYDEYFNESDYRTWQKEKIYLRKNDSTNSSGIFQLPNSQLPQGRYVLEVTAKDKFGEEVKELQYIQLYEEKANSLPAETYAWSVQKNPVIEPGEKSTITIGSSARDLFIIEQVNDRNSNHTSSGQDFTYITLSDERKSFDFVGTETTRGGFGVHHFFVKDNRFYELNNEVNVPWLDKELKISYESFRDKTLPGSQEKWKLKVSGYKKDKVAAEMLAGMYDASLDQFTPHEWHVPDIWESYYIRNNWTGTLCFTQVQAQLKYWKEEQKSFIKIYDRLPTIQPEYITLPYVRIAPQAGFVNSEAKATKIESYKFTPSKVVQDKEIVVDSIATREPISVKNETQNAGIQVRKNFNESAFFFPDLRTDSAGTIEFSFTLPEALTNWKFQALAHTKELAFGYSSASVVTQKPLMVQPNAPRFLREGDKMEFSAKVVNMTDKEITGTVQLELLNTTTGESVSGWFRNMYPTQYFTADAGQSALVKFTIDVPYQYNNAVSYRLVAKAGDNSDGEEASLPVLSNSLLVTESMPLPLRGNTARNFRFEKLLQSSNSETLQQHALTIEFTTNPAWYAVQALPYLMEFPYECAEQTFNRYYANALATKIAASSPKLKTVLENWKTTDTVALLSNLQKNQELKTVLLEETPWVLEGNNEARQKKNIALLFDMIRMSRELRSSFEKLKQLQSPSGGLVWFNGGPDDRYITQYIISGIGHLKKLGVLTSVQQKDWNEILTSAIRYLDQYIKEDYERLIAHKTNLNKNNLGYTQIQYLYMRSFFNEFPMPGASFAAINYYRTQSRQYWVNQNKYMQGMIALSLFRSGDKKTANDILRSLKENSIFSEELGMYWKENTAGYYWHQAQVEAQSLLIEAFGEITKDSKMVADLKTWLLKQKQTRNWKTTKATAEACYALLLEGSDWLNSTPEVEIRLGDKTINSHMEKQESGTGYFKKTFPGQFINPAMGEISLKISTSSNVSVPAWGAVYWQYFEHLEKITQAATPLRVKKTLFVQKNTDRGPVLDPVKENDYLKVGDKIKVRIELRVDRDMEYVHMKDMRASCMEPVNVLSTYNWQGGLGYYESTKDASTNFFFGWLPKGNYVFEYPLFITHSGNFSNGITTIQCMYAPEFASHSEGLRINVE